MHKLPIDAHYLKKTLLEMLDIPSPVGLTDDIVHYVGRQLSALGISYEVTRRGAIRAILRPSAGHSASRTGIAIAAHLDTLGAMVREAKANGRLAISPVGTWSSRWAEGARVTVITEGKYYRGTILPLLASGHVYNEECDKQPVSWENVEVRLDERVENNDETSLLGIEVGDYIALDPAPEILANGYIVSRYLDDKAGVAAILAALKALRDADAPIPAECHVLFTVTEEIGTGSQAAVDPHISEIVGVDIGPVAPGQGARESGVTIPLMDSAGPHNYHLTRTLLKLCREHGIEAHRDVFKFYHSDCGACVNAGHDVRTALLCFGTDATHGYERTHLDCLLDVAQLLTIYVRTGPCNGPTCAHAHH